jgi:hypothetical protein
VGPSGSSPEELGEFSAGSLPLGTYRLAGLLYAALLGHSPHYRPEVGVGELLRSLSTPPTPPSELGVEIDADLERVLMKALSTASAERYPSPSALSVALRTYLRTD